MARVTVEDCVEVVTNRFELVALASERARSISAGAPLTVDRDNDKNPVISLREIADRTVSVENLRESLVQKHTLRKPKEVLDEATEETKASAGGTASELMDEMRSFSHQGDESDDLDADESELTFEDDNLDVDD